jgi:protein-S-isoprenylcysteine O-methyltransferase Ste14
MRKGDSIGFSTFLAAVIYGLFILLVFPLLFIKLNNMFSLPKFSFFSFKILGLALIIAGSIFWLYCIGIFKLIGKGTPVPIQPPKALVVQGLYKYTRNPMYISTLAVVLGYFFFFGHTSLVVYLFLLFIGLHLFVVLYEEPTLTNKFGKQYKNYCSKVKRWI